MATHPSHPASAFRPWLPGAMLALALPLVTPVAAQGLPPIKPGETMPADAIDAEKLFDAIVRVKIQAVPNARSSATLGKAREGSGVVIGDDGLILTIGYLIVEADDVTIEDRKGRSLAAQVVDRHVVRLDDQVADSEDEAVVADDYTAAFARLAQRGGRSAAFGRPGSSHARSHRRASRRRWRRRASIRRFHRRACTWADAGWRTAGTGWCEGCGRAPQGPGGNSWCNGMRGHVNLRVEVADTSYAPHRAVLGATGAARRVPHLFDTIARLLRSATVGRWTACAARCAETELTVS